MNCGKYDYYELLKDIPLCKRGTIFYHDPKDTVRGSIANGCLKLAWLQGSCQNGLAGDAIVFHADARHDRDWFARVAVCSFCKSKLLED